MVVLCRPKRCVVCICKDKASQRHIDLHPALRRAGAGAGAERHRRAVGAKTHSDRSLSRGFSLCARLGRLWIDARPGSGYMLYPSCQGRHWLGKNTPAEVGVVRVLPRRRKSAFLYFC